MKRLNPILYMLVTAVILFFTLATSVLNVSPMVLGKVEAEELALTTATELDMNVLANCDVMKSEMAVLGGAAATWVDATSSHFSLTALVNGTDLIGSKYSLGTTWANKMEELTFSQMTESANIEMPESNPFNAIAMNPFNEINGMQVAGRTHLRV